MAGPGVAKCVTVRDFGEAPVSAPASLMPGATVDLVSDSGRWLARTRATSEAARLVAGDLAIVPVVGGVVLPRGPVDDATEARYAGAVVGRDGAAHPASLRWVDGRPLAPEAGDLAAAADAPHVAGTALYLGPLLEAFGHFLVESTARLWALDSADAAGADHVVFSYRDGPAPAFAETALAALGLGRRLRLVGRPTRFDRVLVPEAAHALGTSVHPAFKRGAEWLGAAILAEAGPGAAGEAVYLTRSRLDPWTVTSAVVGERQIEAALAAAGVAIVAPETLPLARQIALARGARRIAGVDGSALHLALFAERPLDLAVLCRRPLPRPFPAIDKVRVGASHYLDALARPDDPRLVPNAHKARGFPRLLDADRALVFLAGAGFGEAPEAHRRAELAEAAVAEFNGLALAALARDAVRRGRPEVAATVEAARRAYPVAADPALDRLIEEMRAAMDGRETGRGAWKAVRRTARRTSFGALLDRVRAMVGWRR